MSKWDNPVERCPDCHAEIGSLHERGCDIERCARCSGQAFSCFCEVPDEDRIPWTGYWPGAQECQKLGWWAKRDPVTIWRYCGPDEPAAVPDIDRFNASHRWSRKLKKYVPRRRPLSYSPTNDGN